MSRIKGVASVPGSAWDDGDTMSNSLNDTTQHDVFGAIRKTFISLSEISSSAITARDRINGDITKPGTSRKLPQLIERPTSYGELVTFSHSLYRKPENRFKATLFSNFFASGLCKIDQGNWEAVQHGSGVHVNFRFIPGLKSFYLSYNSGRYLITESRDITWIELKGLLQTKYGLVKKDIREDLSWYFEFEDRELYIHKTLGETQTFNDTKRWTDDVILRHDCD